MNCKSWVSWKIVRVKRFARRSAVFTVVRQVVGARAPAGAIGLHSRRRRAWVCRFKLPMPCDAPQFGAVRRSAEDVCWLPKGQVLGFEFRSAIETC